MVLPEAWLFSRELGQLALRTTCRIAIHVERVWLSDSGWATLLEHGKSGEI